jgi:hypothetical protein
VATVRLKGREVKKQDLPFVCMKCGREAAVWKTKTFDWESGKVATLRLLGPVPTGPKLMKAHLPMCQRHRHHWLGRALFAWVVGGLLLAGFGVMLAVASSGPKAGQMPTWFGVVAGISCAGLPLWLIVMLVLLATAIRPTEISEDGITLKGVSPKFMESLEAHRRRRAEERRQHREPPVRQDDGPLPFDNPED